MEIYFLTGTRLGKSQPNEECNSRTAHVFKAAFKEHFWRRKDDLGWRKEDRVSADSERLQGALGWH